MSKVLELFCIDSYHCKQTGCETGNFSFVHDLTKYILSLQNLVRVFTCEIVNWQRAVLFTILIRIIERSRVKHNIVRPRSDFFFLYKFKEIKYSVRNE